MKAKKHVLCEKLVTCNAAELRSSIVAAKENNVLFMEVIWTGSRPLAKKVNRNDRFRGSLFSLSSCLPIFKPTFGIDKCVRLRGGRL